MTKRMEPDIKALRACVRALEVIGTLEMLRANVIFLYDKYVQFPKSPLPVPKSDKPRKRARR